MDRAAFLRSLPYLRQLDSQIWATSTNNAIGNDDNAEVYSGSTVTPPTPSKNNSLLLFEEPAVVSLEPRIVGSGENINDEIMEIDDTVVKCRKRGRADLENATANYIHNPTTPAFFQQYRLDDSLPPKDPKEETAVDNKQEINNARSKGINFESIINSDPALCSFEAAIVQYNPNPLGCPALKCGEENGNDDDDQIELASI